MTTPENQKKRQEKIIRNETRLFILAAITLAVLGGLNIYQYLLNDQIEKQADFTTVSVCSNANNVSLAYRAPMEEESRHHYAKRMEGQAITLLNAKNLDCEDHGFKGLDQKIDRALREIAGILKGLKRESDVVDRLPDTKKHSKKKSSSEEPQRTSQSPSESTSATTTTSTTVVEPQQNSPIVPPSQQEPSHPVPEPHPTEPHPVPEGPTTTTPEHDVEVGDIGVDCPDSVQSTCNQLPNVKVP